MKAKMGQVHLPSQCQRLDPLSSLNGQTWAPTLHAVNARVCRDYVL